MALTAAHVWTTFCVTALTVCTVTSTYINWDDNSVHDKDNHIAPYLDHVKRYGPAFKSDRDVSRYLKVYGLEMMLWRCRNAIQPYWNWKPINFVELYCEAVGRLRTVKWFHNGKELNLGERRYDHLIVPHFANGRYFAKWIDFRLKIFNATTADSGVYTFRAISPKGYSEEQVIYVDISEKKRKKKKKREGRKNAKRLGRQTLERQLAEATPSSKGSTQTKTRRNRKTDINKEHIFN